MKTLSISNYITTNQRSWSTFLSVLCAVGLSTSSCGKRGSRVSRLKDDAAMSYGRKIDATAKIRDMNRAYVDARTSLTGAQGLLETSALLSAKSLQWVKQWESINQYVTSSASRPIDQVDQELKAKLLEQSQLLGQIKTIESMLTNQNATLQEKLKSAPTIDYQVIGYEPQVNALTTHMDHLKTTAQTVTDDAKAHSAKLTTSGADIANALRVKLILVFTAANISQLEAAKARVNDMFTAERILNPFEVEFQREYLDFQGLVSQARTYSVEERLPQLLDKSNAVKQQIENSGVAREYINRSRERIDRLVEEARRTAEKFSNGTYNIPKLAQESFESRISKAKSQCQSNNPGRYNCETYRWLSVLPQSDILGMSALQLKALEKSLDTMESGTTVRRGGL